MGFSTENPLDTLIDELGTQRVQSLIDTPIESSLLWKNENGFVVLGKFIFLTLLNGFHYVGPHIRSVVPIQVYELFQKLFLRRGTHSLKNCAVVILVVICDCIEVVLVSLSPDNVYDFMKRNMRVSLLIRFLVVSEHFVIGDLFELNIELSI